MFIKKLQSLKVKKIYKFSKINKLKDTIVEKRNLLR